MYVNEEEGPSVAAVKIATSVGLLERCETCGEVTDPGSHNIDDALGEAERLWDDQDPLVAGFQNKEQLEEAVIKVPTHFGEVCSCTRQSTSRG